MEVIFKNALTGKEDFEFLYEIEEECDIYNRSYRGTVYNCDKHGKFLTIKTRKTKDKLFVYVTDNYSYIKKLKGCYGYEIEKIYKNGEIHIQPIECNKYLEGKRCDAGNNYFIMGKIIRKLSALERINHKDNNPGPYASCAI